MAENSAIEWTDTTPNPVVGCTKQSAGCENCYAIRMAWRLMHNPKTAAKYAGTVRKTPGGKLNWTGRINYDESALLKIAKAKPGSLNFVNSMGDLFHPHVDLDFTRRVFGAMAKNTGATFQVLTKHPRRMYETLKDDAPHYHIHLGTSVENQEAYDERFEWLLRTPASHRFLSMEPLLGPVDLHLDGTVPQAWGYGYRPVGGFIDWIIVGGESGPQARPLHPDWVRSVRDQLEGRHIAFFFKQWGNYLPFEPDAQAPFWSAASSGESFDAHGMNFTNENAEPGRWMGGVWMDSMEAIMLCEEHRNSQCMFLRLPKKKISRKLDGKEHNDFPLP
jgi:protein gp37